MAFSQALEERGFEKVKHPKARRTVLLGLRVKRNNGFWALGSTHRRQGRPGSPGRPFDVPGGEPWGPSGA